MNLHGEPETPAAGHGSERGSAAVDFTLIGALLTVIFIAIIQLTLVLHVRNTLIDAAASGARYGTLADRAPDDAAERAGSLVRSTLHEGYAQDVSVRETNNQGIRTLEVRIRAPLPVIGLIGPAGMLEVTGHAALPQ